LGEVAPAVDWRELNCAERNSSDDGAAVGIIEGGAVLKTGAGMLALQDADVVFNL
jgi:hypothetical protein